MILVIPDIHQDFTFLYKILDRYGEKAEKIIFLGDYFHSFLLPPEVHSFRNSCKQLKYLVLEHSLKDKFVFCIGNHDIPFIYHNNKTGYSHAEITPTYYCSGLTRSQISDFRKEFFDQGLRDNFFLNNFKLAVKYNGWIFSHGGISIKHIPYGNSINNFIEEIIPDAFNNFRNLSYKYNYLLSDVGICRGGNNQIGGILWHDWKREFFASSDIGKQIVGHTHVNIPDCKAQGTDYESWCLDDGQRSFALINKEGVISIKNIYES